MTFSCWLGGKRILIVEDEYFIAIELARDLKASGAEVAGPVPTLGEGLTLALAPNHLDAAVLDINLRGELVFALADALIARGIPFLFATGYDQSDIPPRFAHIPRWEKPVGLQVVLKTLLVQTSAPVSS